MISIILVSCSSKSNISISEKEQKTEFYEEIIRLNNCGGKSESEQIISRSFGTAIEINAEISVGIQQVVEGGVSAKYGEYRTISKSQRLVAPPGTNMEFVLQWKEEVKIGNLEVDGQIGTYEVKIPISVEQISSNDLGCMFGDSSGILVLEENFEKESYWPLFNIDTNELYAINEFYLEDGVFKWHAVAKRDFYYYKCPIMEPVGNAHSSVKVKIAQGSENAKTGIVIRASKEGFYQFSLIPEKQFFIFKVFSRSEEKWNTIVSGSSSIINTGGWNSIDILAKESQFTIWINNTEIAKVNNNVFLEGLSCISVGLDNAKDEAVWEFDNLIVRIP